MPLDPKQSNEIFLDAIGKPTGERAGFLDKACEANAELRGHIEEMLKAHDEASPTVATAKPGPLDVTGPHTPGGNVSFRFDQPGVQIGSVIGGKYLLLEVIGEGGMGTVYRAQQSEPVKRKVALKLIKAGMDTKAVLRRFEQERQALALMDHPCIAKVFDAGNTPPGGEGGGCPFFVMELVNGLPLTKFCDEAKMTLAERLELFVPICQAVQHAHQKGIVHRDLKPSNILVTIYDGKPVPKVIDFGVAKAVAGKLTDESLSTQFGQVVGTLEYMSPEQAGLSGLDIDTRSDIYSLGVILYELLTGLTPIDVKRLRKAALHELIRVIQEEEPAKPSTRLSTDESLPSLAASRHTEPKRLTALLRGELDCIVMKCLEKQRDRRYDTANGLARDIQRYLADEPVEARPPSASYRLKKFLSRNRGPVLAVALVVLAMAVGVVGTTLGMVRATEALKGEERQRGIAETNATQAGLERDRADEEKRIAQAFSDFLQSDLLLQAASLSQANRGFRAEPNLTVKEALDRASKSIGDRFQDQPLVEAAIRQVIGEAYGNVGEAKLGVPHLVRARDLRLKKLGEEHPLTLKAESGLGLCYWQAGQYDKALPLLEQTVEKSKRFLGVDHVDTLRSMEDLALAYQFRGQLKRAIDLFERVAERMESVLGPDDIDTLLCLSNLAIAYRDDQQTKRALELYEKTLEKRQLVLGKDHPQTLSSLNNLALWYTDNGQYEKALKGFEELLPLMAARLGPNHTNTLNVLANLGYTHLRAHHLDKALAILTDAVAKTTQYVGAEHSLTLTTMYNLGMTYSEMGQFDKSLELQEKVLAGRRKSLGLDHIDTITSLGTLMKAGLTLKRPDVALPLLPLFLDAKRKEYLNTPTRFANILAAVATDVIASGQPEAAEPLFRECLELRQKHEGERWTTYYIQYCLGASLFRQKKYADAEPLLIAGYEGMKAREATIPANRKGAINEALQGVVKLYEAWDKKDKAEEWRKK